MLPAPATDASRQRTIPAGDSVPTTPEARRQQTIPAGNSAPSMDLISLMTPKFTAPIQPKDNGMTADRWDNGGWVLAANSDPRGMGLTADHIAHMVDQAKALPVAGDQAFRGYLMRGDKAGALAYSQGAKPGPGMGDFLAAVGGGNR